MSIPVVEVIYSALQGAELNLMSEVEISEEYPAVRQTLMGLAKKELALILEQPEVEETKFLGLVEIWEEKFREE